jgi:hypothetical protein
VQFITEDDMNSAMLQVDFEDAAKDDPDESAGQQ